MKDRFKIALLALLLLAPLARAASPTFTSFDTNDFTVITNTSPWDIRANFLWTNAATIYRPTRLQSALNATNITSYGALMSAGALVPYGNFLFNLTAGTNNINPFGASIARLNAPTTTASDTTVRLGVGNGFGQLFWIHNYADTAFTLHNGDTLFDAPLLTVYLPGGDWTPSHRGDAIALFQTEIGWEEAYRVFATSTNIVANGLWNSDGTYLYPVTNSWFTMLPPPGLIVDTNSLTWYGTPGLGDGIALLSLGPDTGGAFKTLDVGVFDPLNDNNESDLRYTAGPNISTLQLFANLGSTNYRSAGISAGIPAYWFFTDTVDGLTTNLFLYDPANAQGVATWRFGGYADAAHPMAEIFDGDVDSGLPLFTFGPDGYLNIQGHTFSEVQLNGPSAGSLIDFYQDDTRSYLHMQNPDNGGMITVYLEPNQSGEISAPFSFGTYNIFTNSPLLTLFNGTNAIVSGIQTLSFGPEPQITFGPGSTNVLYRSTTDLIYTNGAVSPNFSVVSGAGKSISVGIKGDGTGLIDASGGVLTMNKPTVINGNLVPQSRAYSLGLTNSSSAQWKNFAALQASVVDTDDGVGNYSQLTFFVTNGVAVLNFNNAGSGTPPTKISFRTNGVEVGHFP